MNDTDKTRGLYDKYNVTRTDGSSEPGGKHENCKYFVLDMDHDPIARFALTAYAMHAFHSYPILARDLVEVHSLIMPDQAPAWFDVLDELRRAVEKFPTWPTDPLHAAGVLNEEVGELNKAVLQAIYEPHKSGTAEVREEAIQAAAMALRFVASLHRYDYCAGLQHNQGVPR